MDVSKRLQMDPSSIHFALGDLASWTRSQWLLGSVLIGPPKVAPFPSLSIQPVSVTDRVQVPVSLSNQSMCIERTLIPSNLPSSLTPIAFGDCASGNSKRLYNVVSQTLGLPNLDSFYRLFLIPGMSHCAGGNGAFADIAEYSTLFGGST